MMRVNKMLWMVTLYWQTWNLSSVHACVFY